MSSTYSRASVALAPALNVSVLKPSHFVKLAPSVRHSSRSIGHRFQSSPMSAPSAPKRLPPMALVQLTLFAEDTPASRSRRQGSAEARRMTVTSGLKCLGSPKNFGPIGLLEKMLLGTSLWGSTMCWMTWRTKVTPRGRLLFRLVPYAPHRRDRVWVVANSGRQRCEEPRKGLMEQSRRAQAQRTGLSLADANERFVKQVEALLAGRNPAYFGV